MARMVTITVTRADAATLAAALMSWTAHGKGEPENRSNTEHAIATGYDTEISIDTYGCTDLLGTVLREAGIHNPARTRREPA